MRPMISHPSMTSRGKRIAGVLALMILFFLPKHVPCGYPDGQCGHQGVLRLQCKPYEVEPLGLFALEKLAKRDIGFAYSSGEDCR